MNFSGNQLWATQALRHECSASSDLIYCRDAMDAANKADALVLITDWSAAAKVGPPSRFQGGQERISSRQGENSYDQLRELKGLISINPCFSTSRACAGTGPRSEQINRRRALRLARVPRQLRVATAGSRLTISTIPLRRPGYAEHDCGCGTGPAVGENEGDERPTVAVHT